MARSRTPKTEEVSLSSESDLNEHELRFVDEYLIDRDATAAALRTGVARINLKKTVMKWMGDHRILRMIQLRTDTADLDKMITPQRIMAGFIDVAFDRNAPSAARNSALRELAALKKMYGEDDKDKTGSGVILVPVAGTLEDWKALSMAAQSKLKEDVRG